MRTYALEMMLATMMVSCGVVLLWPGETFAMAHYGLMREFVNEEPGGLFLLAVGLLRWVAVLRNGGDGKGRTYTPLYRIGGCAVGCGFWLTLGVAAQTSIMVDDVATGPPLLIAIAVTASAFELYSAMRGGEDASRYDSLHRRQSRSKVGTNGRA